MVRRRDLARSFGDCAVAARCLESLWEASRLRFSTAGIFKQLFSRWIFALLKDLAQWWHSVSATEVEGLSLPLLLIGVAEEDVVDELAAAGRVVHSDGTAFCDFLGTTSNGMLVGRCRRKKIPAFLRHL